MITTTLADEVASKSDDKPAHRLSAQVRAPDGDAVTNLAVVRFDYFSGVAAKLKDVTVQGGDQIVRTDAQGRFTVEWNGGNIGLMAASSNGFVLAQSRDLTNGSILFLEPWGRIEGIRTDHNHPLSNHRVSLDIIGRCVDLEIESPH